MYKFCHENLQMIQLQHCLDTCLQFHLIIINCSVSMSLYLHLSFLQVFSGTLASPFHNCRTSTLQHFAIGIFQIRTRSFIRCTSPRIRCMRFSARINSPGNCGHAHYSDATKCDPNHHSATPHKTLVRTFFNVLYNRKSDARFLKVVR